MTTQPVVLIVDDEEICLMITSEMVKKIGLPTMTASDGLEAVEIFEQHGHRIGCVLMDLQMPRMNGIDACRRIREMDENMPLIIASGYINGTIVELLKPLKPAGYLNKPVNFKELYAFLRQITVADDSQAADDAHTLGRRNSL